MNFRLIDAETSEVVYTRQIESIIRERGLTFGGLVIPVVAASAVSSRATPGRPFIAGANKGVYELVKQIGAPRRAASGRRAAAFNLGRGVVAAGDELRVVSKGEELIDPETGLSLGSMDAELGSVRVAVVQDQFSIAETISMSGTPSRGDRVVSTVAPPSIEFAPGWQRPKRGKF